MSSNNDTQHNPNKKAVGSLKQKGKKKFILISSLVILVILVGVSAFLLWPTNVSRQEATDIAIAYVGGGTANRPDIDFERLQRVWFVEVFYNGLVHQVYVSTRTGEVVAMEVGRW